MNPRSFAAQVRRAIEAYQVATGVVPIVEIEGDRFTLRAPAAGATDSEEVGKVQREFDTAFGGKP